MKTSKRYKWARWILESGGAQAKEYKRIDAQHVARMWVVFAEQRRKTTWTKEQIAALQKGLIDTLATASLSAIATGNADFFRWFADALEIKGEHWDGQRRWFYERHKPDAQGNFPTFTHAELLNDADTRGISISERQLRRLMAESPFQFKHARR